MNGLGGPAPVSYLPPLSPRSSPKSLLLSLAGRYSATYTVTPTSIRERNNHLRIKCSDGGLVKSKSYTPLHYNKETLSPYPAKAITTSNHSNVSSGIHTKRSPSTPPTVSSRTSSRTSSNQSISSEKPSSLPLSRESSFCGSCPSSPSNSIAHPRPSRSVERPPQTLSRSLSYGGSPSNAQVPSSKLSPTACNSSVSLHCPTSDPDIILKRNSLEEWILCTVKKPALNRRVATMSSLSLKDNIDQYHKWMRDIPHAEKATRLTKSRNSFRFGKNKGSSGSRASGVSGKTVPVKGHSSVEELERKQGDLIRLLEGSEDAVRKNIPTYLVGLPSLVLENAIAITREIDQMSPNANSSELASLMSHMNQTVAEYALWTDLYYLYENKSHSGQTIGTLVQNVRQAVKNLVEFAINKENQNASESSFFHTPGNGHNESNSSLCSQDSPFSRKKLNETRNSHTHGSMPEIPSATSGCGTGTAHFLSKKTNNPPSSKLTHSFSSDSILDKENNGNSSTPSNPSVFVGDYEGVSSCDELAAPPVPPKKGAKGGRNSLRSSYNEFDSPGRLNSPFNSSFEEGGSEFLSGRPSGGLIISCSTPQSLDHSSDYSLNHSVDDRNIAERPHSPYSTDFCPATRVSDLTSLSHNCDLSSLRSGTDESNSSGYTSSTISNSSKTHNFQSLQSFSEGRFSSSTIDSGKETASQFSQMTCVMSSSQQHLAIQRSARNSACSSSSRSSGSEAESNTISMSVPPPIPKKTRSQHSNVTQYSEKIQSSHYDNVDGGIDKADFRHHLDPHIKQNFGKTAQELTTYSANSSTSELGSSKSSMTSWESSTSSSSPASSTVIQRRYNEQHSSHTSRLNRSSTEKPPLPMKQRHIMEYMQYFKDYEIPEKEWFQHRRSQQVISSYHTHLVSLSDEFKELELESHAPNSRLSLPSSSCKQTPPALPPKRKSRSPDCHQKPPIANHSQIGCYVPGRVASWERPELCSCQIKDTATVSSLHPVQPNESSGHAIMRAKSPGRIPDTRNTEKEGHNDGTEGKRSSDELPSSEFEEEGEISLLDSLNVNEHIVFQGEPEESDVKAGSVDALVVYATYSKNGTYLEAFLTTYRTFLTPAELIEKLFYRYHKFVCRSSTEYQKAAKNAFSLLVRVVHDLVVTELRDKLLEDLAQFDHHLLSNGDLKLALYFRKKLCEKLMLSKTHQDLCDYPLAIENTQPKTLLDFKSEDIANQMTLLDSELFSKFGIPELLHYSRDQNEELCPNLAVFAMQINRMSAWVKTQILRSNSQDRERYYKKFIKIMKHLRKVNNNFNSCIAILSGLESTDVRRLDWPKASTDMLKEYCDLFDFEGSYRAYRQAIAETKPPCIPHLGIILQDLTKLYHINPDFVDGKINFLKRWLQFNILEDMKRFIPSKYDIRKDDTKYLMIRRFINNYEDCMTDTDLWDLSLSIKPKAKAK